jgi:nicotinamidase/pyrazinamidase
MAGSVFWDVDTQYDFMHADGKLYVPDSESIIPNLKRLTDHAHQAGIRIVASADDHVPGHRELSDQPDFRETFPPHCMRGTPGQRKIPETALRNPLVIEPEPMDRTALARQVRSHDGDVLLHKHWFDVFTNPNVHGVLDGLGPEEVVLYGVALDVCDRYAVEGLLEHRPQVRLSFVTDAARAIAEERRGELLERWERRGVEMVTTDLAVRRPARVR